MSNIVRNSAVGEVTSYQYVSAIFFIKEIEKIKILKKKFEKNGIKMHFVVIIGNFDDFNSLYT